MPHNSDYGMPGLMAGGERPKGLGGILGELFTGERDPRLSDEQEGSARRQALISGGLSTIMAAQSTSSPLAALAAGTMAGRAQGQQARSSMSRQEYMQGLQQAFGGPVDESKLQQLAVQLTTIGDIEGAKAITELLKAMPQEQEPQKPMALPGGSRLVNPETGEEIVGVQPEAPPGPMALPSGSRLVDPTTGREIVSAIADLQGDPEYKQRDLGDRIEYWLGSPDNVVFTIPKVRSADERMRILKGGVESHVSNLERLIGEVDASGNFKAKSPPSRGQALLGAIGARELLPTELQQLKISSEAVARTYTFLISGVTARKDEVAANIRRFTPRAGESPAVLKQKYDDLQDFKRLLNNPAAWHPDAQGEFSPEGNSLLTEMMGGGK